MKKSVIVTIIVLASFLAGIIASIGALKVMNIEMISEEQSKLNENEINSLKNKLMDFETKITENTKSIIIDKNEDGRFYCIANGRADIRSSQTIAFQKAKLDANTKLLETIHGIQITNDYSIDSRKSTSKSSGMLKNVTEIERNIINDAIAEVKLKIFFDEQ